MHADIVYLPEQQVIHYHTSNPNLWTDCLLDLPPDSVSVQLQNLKKFSAAVEPLGLSVS
jgi:hypothetical protein